MPTSVAHRRFSELPVPACLWEPIRRLRIKCLGNLNQVSVRNIAWTGSLTSEVIREFDNLISLARESYRHEGPAPPLKAPFAPLNLTEPPVICNSQKQSGLESRSMPDEQLQKDQEASPESQPPISRPAPPPTSQVVHIPQEMRVQAISNMSLSKAMERAGISHVALPPGVKRALESSEAGGNDG